MKKLIFTLLISSSALFTRAQQQTFPDVVCETLSNKIIKLPADVKGKKTVVVIALSPKAEKELHAWSQPLYNALIAEGMGGLMGGRMYNANLCFVGMLKGVVKFASSEIIERSKKNIDKKLWDNYMITDKEVKAFMEAANISKTDEPQFFVLDKDGNIIYRTSGKYTDAKLNEIQEKLM